MKRLQAAQVFDVDHHCTQQTILLQLFQFHHSPATEKRTGVFKGFQS
jgi:hypothetical protein